MQLTPYLDPLPLDCGAARHHAGGDRPGRPTRSSDAGFRILEVPLNSPRPYDSIRRFAQAHGARLPRRRGHGAARRGRARACARRADAIVVMPHADLAIDPRSEAAGHGVRARRRDAHRSVRRARRRRRWAQDVSRRSDAARGAARMARGAAQGRARICRRRHEARQSRRVLGGGRVGFRHGIESVQAGNAARVSCAKSRRRMPLPCARCRHADRLVFSEGAIVRIRSRFAARLRRLAASAQVSRLRRASSIATASAIATSTVPRTRKGGSC